MTKPPEQQNNLANVTVMRRVDMGLLHSTRLFPIRLVCFSKCQSLLINTFDLALITVRPVAELHVGLVGPGLQPFEKMTKMK